MRILLFIIASLSFAEMAFAQRFQPVTHSMELIEKVVVRGLNGRLEIIQQDSQILRVEGQKEASESSKGWTYELVPKGKTLEILVKNSFMQKSWQGLTSGQQVPVMNLRIFSPARDMEVFWHAGDVVAKNWQASLALQMTNGKVSLSQGEGELRVQLVKGQLSVVKHNGGMDIQSFHGQVKVQGSQGNLTIQNHSASVGVEEHQGGVTLDNHSGRMALSQIVGSVKVNNVSGIIRLREFEGDIDGDFERGQLHAKINSFQSIHLRSNDAALTVDVPKESGAGVFIRTEKGKLWAPLYIGRNKKGKWTERKGRLRGKEQGNIKIISKYGDIVLK